MNAPTPWSTDTKPSWLTPEIEAQLVANKLPLDKDGMLLLWQKSKDMLTHWKELEMEWRKVCAEFLVPDKTEGTVNVELGAGYKAKVVHKYNIKLDSDNDKVWSSLDKISAIGNEGKFIAERLVSWHPTFLKTEYVTLQEEAAKGSQQAKEMIKIIETEMITITEAAPTLSIVEPKAKKK